jgi:hypothetical protein
MEKSVWELGDFSTFWSENDEVLGFIIQYLDDLVLDNTYTASAEGGILSCKIGFKPAQDISIVSESGNKLVHVYLDVKIDTNVQPAKATLVTYQRFDSNTDYCFLDIFKTKYFYGESQLDPDAVPVFYGDIIDPTTKERLPAGQISFFKAKGLTQN